MTQQTVDPEQATPPPGEEPPPERAEIGQPFVRPARLLVLAGLVAALGLSQGLPMLAVVGSILVFIFFHELGHFLAARRAGMKVTEFFIGFGPRIWSFRRGEVEYGIKAIPAGAYVKIVGMSKLEEVPEEDEGRTYRQKSFPQRLLVAVAGSAMHFAWALVLLYTAFVTVGTRDAEHWVVNQAVPGSAAERIGIRHGDRIVSIAGVEVKTQEQMGTEARKHSGKPIQVGIERDGVTRTENVTLNSRMNVYGTVGEDLSLFSPGGDQVLVSAPVRTGVLARAGLRDGDRLVSVNGTAVTTLDGVREVVKRASTGDLALRYVHPEAPERTIDATVALGTAVDAGPIQGFLGVGEDRIPQRSGPFEAVPKTFSMFGDVAWMSITGLGRFFHPSNVASFASRVVHTAPGETHQSDKPQSAQATATANVQRESTRMTSIVGASMIGAQLTEGGWANFLAFLAQLNIIIGIFNLVPLLPFDGGHVAVATYEKIRELFRRDGKRYFTDFNKLMPLTYAVVMVLLVVGVMAIYLDLADPLRLL